jgi:hypothetical protein
MRASELRFAQTAKALVDSPPPAHTADHVDTAVAWLLETTTSAPATAAH